MRSAAALAAVLVAGVAACAALFSPSVVEYAAADDAGTPDAPDAPAADAPTTRFCADSAAHFVCDDFDDGDSIANRWSISRTDASYVAAWDATAFSQPFSMVGDWTAEDASDGFPVHAAASLKLPPGRTIAIDFELWPAFAHATGGGLAGQDTSFFRFEIPQDGLAVLSLYVTGTEGAPNFTSHAKRFQSDGGAQDDSVLLPLLPATWYHVSITIDLGKATFVYKLADEVKTLGTVSGAIEVPSGQAGVNFGPWTSVAFTHGHVAFDNVVIDVSP
jgi:hypothetical protein